MVDGDLCHRVLISSLVSYNSLYVDREGSNATKNHWKECLAQILRHKPSPVQDKYRCVTSPEISKGEGALGILETLNSKGSKVIFQMILMVFSSVVTCLVVSTLTAACHCVS